MLVECPRCHFRQPQDQYCANCGVDMLAYKPKEDPFLIKIAKSGMFQFLMVVLLGIGVTYFVVRTDQPQQWIQKINRFASVSPNTSKQAKTEAGIAEDQAEFEAPPPEANTWAAHSTSPTEMAATAEGATAGSAVAQASTFKAGTGGVSPTQTVAATAKLRVLMVEIDHDYLSNLSNERSSRMNNLDGDISFFRTFANPSADTTNVKVLKTDLLDFANTKNNTITVGNSARWFRLTFSALDLTNASKIFDAYVIKNHPNDTQQIPVDLYLAPGEKGIISGTGLLSYFDVETDLANLAPFTIFKSTDYRNQKTTFAIIIELQ